jgi:redox-sensing transcriptional repressor
MSAKATPISEATVNRLSVYLRCLQILEREGEATISSQQMAKRFHLNSAQIRKDLAYFGAFGTRGVGYSIPNLKAQISRLLKLDEEKRVVIVGAGHLGQALADFQGFNSGGFKVVALFDTDQAKVGRNTAKRNIPILPVEEINTLVRDQRVTLGIIAVHPQSAQEVYDELTRAGVKGILNFAPAQIKEKPKARLKAVDLKINMETLSFFTTA